MYYALRVAQNKNSFFEIAFENDSVLKIANLSRLITSL